MAFYAEMVRRNSWFVNNMNQISFYKKTCYEEEQARKKKEYDDWYASLSDEERAELARREDERTRREREELLRSMRGLLALPMAVASMYSRSSGFSRYDKYGVLYNYDGTPNENFFNKDVKQDDDIIDVEGREIPIEEDWRPYEKFGLC